MYCVLCIEYRKRKIFPYKIQDTKYLILVGVYAILFYVMATLSDDDVRHIAKLCRLNLSDKEVKKFAKELSSILDFVEQLQEVDTKGVEPTPQPTGISNRFRADEIVDDGPTTKEMLECSPLPIIDNQIQTPSAHG